jgi:hypothetical protein
MRDILGLIVAGLALQVVSAQTVPDNQPNLTRNDILAGRLWRIAAATHTRIGFQATDIVRTDGYVKRIPPVSVSTLEDALDAVVGADDRYEWRRANDIVLVRPKGAWDDPSDPLNRPLRNADVESATASWVLKAVRDFVYTGKFAITGGVTAGPRPVSFHVSSGTVVDVLNELMIAADSALWIASYRPIGQPAERFPNWDLDLQIRNFDLLTALSSSGPRVER